jgi:hypothetical protein
MIGSHRVERRAWHREFFSVRLVFEQPQPLHQLIAEFNTSVFLRHFELSLTASDDCIACLAWVPAGVDPDTLDFHTTLQEPSALFPAPSLVVWLGLVSTSLLRVPVSKVFHLDISTRLFLFILPLPQAEEGVFSCSFSVNVSS